MAFIGQEKLINFFDGNLNKGSLSHAYCLVGPDQIGKRKLTRYIASQLLKVGEEKLETHPDFYYLSRDRDEKTDKLKKNISIKQSRRLKEQVGKRSWMGGYSVAIIDEAELLNKESGNALLKILEDARENIVFFLLTTDDSALLPTIRSRCQLFYLSLVPDEKLSQGLQKLGYNGKIIEQAVKLSWGRPGRAINLLEDEDLRQDYLKEFKRWEKMISQSFHERLNEVKDLLKEKGTVDKDKLLKIFDIWQMLWRGVMHDKVKGHQRSQLAKQSEADLPDLREFIDLLKKSKMMVRQNVNVKLVVEELLLKAY